MRLLLTAILILIASGCASKLYRGTEAGRFSGAIDVRWIRSDYFLFTPNEDDPFLFTRRDGSVIRPGPMYTDGGSIPRFLWGIEGYSPWGYAPAYIIHDWIFEAHHCGYASDSRYTFADSTAVMGESLKALMEESPEYRNYFVFDSVIAAVGSPIAKRLWEDGSCKPPPIDLFAVPETVLPGELIMRIQFK
ncbi:DUF1353 domain-containing protein [Aromatoleum petrolei]|uniref:DUF1353 domain-containing protein n=1 Tax=Aromatoleum petrolei TaxID=76116 RepID=A0ABX1MJR4_9RHOO|nr:DUF1353 domain-containing protein [Aromatoleum petrolei]NMF88193.1 DUF1353 domain-containing protein [Aromatoleum petrolei]QTQ38950.1 putative protein DUF1353 [Aromatoleum petrolei]